MTELARLAQRLQMDPSQEIIAKTKSFYDRSFNKLTSARRLEGSKIMCLCLDLACMVYFIV